MSASSSSAIKRIRGLRANSLAAVVMLSLQYSLGIYVNLYSTLPASDTGKALFPGFAVAVAKGPVVLSIHAILGTLLLISASTAVIRSVRMSAPAPIALTVVGLLAILAAWLSGSIFIGKQTNGHSIAMALATAVALLCYVLVLFLLMPRSEVAAERLEAIG